MDYESPATAAWYDAARALGEESIDTWTAAIAALVAPARVNTLLDVGCGTGRFTAALGACFDADAIGVDPSEAMLARARAKPGTQRVRFMRGPAERIPLADASVDLAFMSMVYHHLDDHDRTLDELRRVLAPGGHLAIRESTTDRLDTVPYLAFFPAARPINEARLHAVRDIVTTVERHGFTAAGHRTLAQTHAASLAEYCDRIAARAHSDLAAIDDAAFASGLDAMRAAATAAPSAPVSEEIDLFVFRA